MYSIFAIAIAAAVVDSLNPVAIAQQFVLQGLARRRQHIWFYISATFFTNLLGGLLVYFGAAALLRSFLADFFTRHLALLLTAELLLGIVLIVATSHIFTSEKIRALEDDLAALKGSPPPEKQNREHHVGPASLFVLGSVATLCELPSSLPYFAFLAVLLTHALPIWLIVTILVVYNLIYSAPLMLMYLLYVRCQDRFDSLYRWFTCKTNRLLKILTPLVTGGAGVFLISHAITGMLV